MIVTAGGIDTHIHFICPQQIDEALMSGVTTMLGGGTGPATGTNATTCTPGPWHIASHAAGGRSVADEPRLPRQGQRQPAARRCDEQIEAGAIGPQAARGLGHHAGGDRQLPDAWPTRYDVQVAIHTDTLNESGFVEDTIAAFKGRTIHTFHTEGAGGGHAPDIIKACGEPNVLPSSTNPTRPYTVNTHRRAPRHADGVPPPRPERSPKTSRSPKSRIRRETIAAEDILHDLGAFSMMSSDSQAMGRVGEVDHAHLADRAQDEGAARQRCARTRRAHDNFRVKRYIAKYTINPAITHGIAHEVGSIEVGKLADLVLWKPAFFGVKPSLIIKGGMIAAAPMGDPNASIPTPQPVHYRPMFGALGGALAATSRDVRVAGGAATPASRRRSGCRSAAGRRARTRARMQQARHDPQRRDRRRSRSTRRPTKCAPTASC